MRCRVAERPCPNRLARLSGQRSSISSDLLFYFVFLPSLVTVQGRRILSDRCSLVSLVNRRTGFVCFEARRAIMDLLASAVLSR